MAHPVMLRLAAAAACVATTNALELEDASSCHRDADVHVEDPQPIFLLQASVHVQLPLQQHIVAERESKAAGEVLDNTATSRLAASSTQSASTLNATADSNISLLQRSRTQGPIDSMVNSKAASLARSNPVAARDPIRASLGYPVASSFADSMHGAAKSLEQFSLIIAIASVFSWFYPKKQAKAVGLDTAALSGFRALLAFWVFTEHLGLHQINGGGAFVVLSGCVLSTSRRNAETGLVKSPVSSPQKYFEFVWARLWRVLPLYWVFLSLQKAQTMSDNPVGVVISTAVNFMRLPFDRPLAAICWWPEMSKLGHLWFVGVIVFLYCVYPVLEFVVLGSTGTRKPSRAWLLAVFGICVLLKAAEILWVQSVIVGASGMGWMDYTMKSNGLDLYSCPFLRIPEFMLGMIVPHLAVEHERLIFDFQHFLAYAAVVACDLVLVAMIMWSWLAPQTQYEFFLTDFNVQAPLIAIVMWGFCYGPYPSPVGQVLSHPLLIAIGEWGYGIYLFHIGIEINMGLFNQRFPPCDGATRTMPACGVRAYGPAWAWPAAVVAFALSCLISWSTFRLVEETFQDWGRRLLLTLKGGGESKTAAETASPSKPPWAAPAESGQTSSIFKAAPPVESSKGKPEYWSQKVLGLFKTEKTSSPLEKKDENKGTESLEKRFETSAQFMRDNSGVAARRLSKEKAAKFYGLFKQVNSGDNQTPQPWLIQVEAYAKWTAWRSEQGRSKQDCMEEYINLQEAFEEDLKSRT